MEQLSKFLLLFKSSLALRRRGKGGGLLGDMRGKKAAEDSMSNRGSPFSVCQHISIAPSSILKNVYIMCVVCMYVFRHTHVMVCMRKSKTTLWSLFSPSTFMWVCDTDSSDHACVAGTLNAELSRQLPPLFPIHPRSLHHLTQTL